MASTKVSRSAVAILQAAFSRNGCVRQQDPKRLRAEGYAGYKKGDEVRLFAFTRRELYELRRALHEADFAPGSPFEKGRRWCLPIYGREEVDRFLRLVRRRRASAH